MNVWQACFFLMIRIDISTPECYFNLSNEQLFVLLQNFKYIFNTGTCDALISKSGVSFCAVAERRNAGHTGSFHTLLSQTC